MLSCCCLLAAIDEVRLAARSEGASVPTAWLLLLPGTSVATFCSVS